MLQTDETQQQKLTNIFQHLSQSAPAQNGGGHDRDHLQCALDAIRDKDFDPLTQDEETGNNILHHADNLDINTLNEVFGALGKRDNAAKIIPALTSQKNNEGLTPKL